LPQVMSRRRRRPIVLAIVAMLALAVPVAALAAKPPPPPPVTIQLLNTSDWHGQLDPSFGVGGAWALSARYQEDRLAYPTLTLTGGDDFGATPPLSSFFDEETAVLAQRMMGLQVSALGNHNFDRGLEHLQRMIDLAGAPTSAEAPGTPYRYVAANLRNLKANLTGVDPVAYFNIGGAKVAVIGITNEEAPSLVTPGNFGTIEITDGIAAANKYAAIARKAGANVVVVVTHKGFRGFDVNGYPFGELVDFANGVQGVDVVMGDHTDIQHQQVINGVLVHETKSKGGSYAKTLLTLQPGKGGAVTDKSASFVVPTAPARTTAQLVAAECPDPTGPNPAKYCDPAILGMLSPYRTTLAGFLDVKLATASTTFPYGGATTVHRIQENELGNLIADGMRWYQDTDFALFIGGGIRATLPSSYAPLDTSLERTSAPFDIVLGDVYTVLPFTNTVLRRNVTGIQLWQAMEHGVSAISGPSGGANGRFPQISGFKFSFDYELATGCAGTAATRVCVPNRVYEVKLPDGTPIPYDNTVYTLATVNFLNQGGDDYRMLLDGQTGSNEFLDATVMQLYLEYLGANDADTASPYPLLVPTLDGRINKCGACAP
jgi:2',3'-cyclic-nucleotide 2'-phosphodiesterase (5'-nucleotidase family)